MYVSKFFHLICVLNIVIIYKQFLSIHKRFKLVKSHEYQIYIQDLYSLYPNVLSKLRFYLPYIAGENFAIKF